MQRFGTRSLLTALIALLLASGAIISNSSKAQAAVNLDNCPTLSYGYRGGCVQELQIELNLLGATPQLATDGIFGQHTRNAVESYQFSRGLGVDGVVGPQTKRSLAQESSVATPHSGTPLDEGVVEPGIHASDHVMGLICGTAAATVAIPFGVTGVGAAMAAAAADGSCEILLD